MLSYYVTADLDRAPTGAELLEIGVPRAKIFTGRVKAILCAESVQDACAKGLKCIEGCVATGIEVSNVGCMSIADAKSLGDEPIYKSYRTITWLLYYRLKTGMTQTALAEASGVNPRQIQKIESGDILAENVTARNLIAIADALGVDIKDLL